MAFDREKLEEEVWEKIFEMSPKLSKNFNIKDTEEWKNDLIALKKKVKMLGSEYDYLYMEIYKLEHPLSTDPDEIVLN